jgi:uncharacterized protein
VPPSLTYPGVYIEEVPSGVRTIVGVATSITALIGAAPIGPVDTAIEVDSWAEYERTFGGLWDKSRLGFAVRDFFLNGGNRALIIRVYGGDATADTATITKGNLTLAAASPGLWANNLRVRATHPVTSTIQIAAENLGVPIDDLFDLTIHDASTPTGATEIYHNLTYQAGSGQRIDLVLASQSALAVWKGDPPSSGHPDPHEDVPDADTDKIWTDDNYSTGVGAAIGDEPALTSAAFVGDQFAVEKRGLFALEQADLFNLLCIPPFGSDDDMASVVDAAVTYCETRRAMLLLDPPSTWTDATKAHDGYATLGTRSTNAAIYFPKLMQPNPLRGGLVELFAPCGAVAGVFARTDGQRGVWKAPAGQDAALVGVPQLEVKLTDDENGRLNPLGVNCLRSFPVTGRVVWGSRTLNGNDMLASDWKYVPVRRTALFIEESLYRGTQWVVFEPNDEPLWAEIRLSIGAFLQGLFRQGAFQGATPRDAYFVKCDSETTTQADINLGIVNILVGFAPLKPAEFVVVKLQQMAGQIDT